MSSIDLPVVVPPSDVLILDHEAVFDLQQANHPASLATS
ncbi:hypothetical protein GGQ68_000804 [Sagittula marina]|uniref:Uncharacterized protein n=1 Tax=Sagittula marina TaxID=943940 RepID=A0A7W6DK21_9RHOB|nr:hypothetical protein [Sagittula marina]